MVADDWISQYEEFLKIHRQRLAANLQTQATMGVHTPAHIVTDIYEARAEIQRIKSTLRAAGANVADFPDDIPLATAPPPPALSPGAAGGISIKGSTISGDVIQGNVTKTINQYMSNSQNANPDSLNAVFLALRQAVPHNVPSALRPEAEERVSWLEKSVLPGVLDLALMEAAVMWFGKSCPSLLQHIQTILNHPILAQRVMAAGQMTSFRQRFGGIEPGKESSR